MYYFPFALWFIFFKVHIHPHDPLELHFLAGPGGWSDYLLSVSTDLRGLQSRALVPHDAAYGGKKALSRGGLFPFRVLFPSIPAAVCQSTASPPRVSRVVVELAHGCPGSGHLPLGALRLHGLTLFCVISPGFPMLLSQVQTSCEAVSLFCSWSTMGTFSRACSCLATRNMIWKKNLHYPVKERVDSCWQPSPLPPHVPWSLTGCWNSALSLQLFQVTRHGYRSNRTVKCQQRAQFVNCCLPWVFTF